MLSVSLTCHVIMAEYVWINSSHIVSTTRLYLSRIQIRLRALGSTEVGLNELRLLMFAYSDVGVINWLRSEMQMFTGSVSLHHHLHSIAHGSDVMKHFIKVRGHATLEPPRCYISCFSTTAKPHGIKQTILTLWHLTSVKSRRHPADRVNQMCDVMSCL